MRLFSSFAMVTLATLSLSLFAPLPASAERAACIYSSAEIATIMHMRDNGDGLSDVVKVVGGSRAEVKAAEAAEKARRKAVREGRGVDQPAYASR